MRHELFIDNKKVDLSLSTNINLTYKSNLLSKLDKITSSYSYTIKLPKTKRNMELIEGCNIPSNDSSFAYLTHRARLLRDGIEIVRDAVVVVLSVGDDIQISISWGNASVLSDFLTSDYTLKDLDFGNITWTKAITNNTPKADYGNGMKFYQPVVKCNDIISKIFQNGNVIYQKPTSDLLNKTVIPCLSSVGIIGEITSASITLSLNKSEVAENDFDDYIYFRATESEYFELRKFDFNDDFDDPNKLDYDGFVLADKELSVRIKGKIVVIESSGQSGVTAILADKYITIKGIYNEERFYYKYVDPAERGWKYTFEIDTTIKGSDIKEDSFIEFKVTSSVSSSYRQRPTFVDVDVIPVNNLESEVTPEDGDVNYNLSINMSDISQIDFLKGIMSMMGWYAEPMEGDSGIRMLPYSTITDNKSKAVDWSDKIVNRRIEPSDIEFRMSEMAQKNFFRYADDETVTGDYDSYIMVDDKTLEARKDIITLPFAATDTVNNLPSIPLYSYNDKGELQINSGLTPRILIQEGTTLKFDGLQWNKLIQANWQVYQNIIRRPKIITEQVRLNAIDLKNIDMTIPVYISQYGSYFAILEIKTKNDDICDVQLLKI